MELITGIILLLLFWLGSKNDNKKDKKIEHNKTPDIRPIKDTSYSYTKKNTEIRREQKNTLPAKQFVKKEKTAYKENNSHILTGNEKEAERLFSEAKYIYDRGGVINWESIISKLENALKLYNNPKYSTLLEKAKKEHDKTKTKSEKLEDAEVLYINAVKLKKQGLYEKALAKINEAIRIINEQNTTISKYTNLQKALDDKINNRQNHIKTQPTQQNSKKYHKTISNYGQLADENEFIPDSVIEIIKEKEHSKSVKNKPKENKEIIETKPQDEFESKISNIEYFIQIKTHNNALNCIKEAYKLAKGDPEKTKKVQEFEHIIATERLNSRLDSIYQLSKHNYKEAITCIKSFIKEYPCDKTLKQKLKDTEEEFDKYIGELEQKAAYYIKSKEYKNAINTQNKLISLCPENGKYKETLKEIEEVCINLEKGLKSVFWEAERHYVLKEYTSALNSIEEALKIAERLQIDSKVYADFSEKITMTVLEKEEADRIEKDFQEIKENKKNENFDYDESILRLKKLITAHSELTYLKDKKTIKKYNNFLAELIDECGGPEAEEHYKQAKICLENKEYFKSIEHIDTALKYAKENKRYLALKVELIYKNALDGYNKGKFDKVAKNMRIALKLKPDSEECQKLLEKAERAMVMVKI